MHSKFIKASKPVTRMLSEGRTTDLANYIQLGNSIENLFLMTVSDDLAKHGLSMNMLAQKGSIVSLNTLLQKLGNESSFKTLDRDLLKHYGFVLDRALKLWKENRLENMCPALERDLDERAVTHLMRIWNNKDSSRKNLFIDYVDSCIVRHVGVFTDAIKKGSSNAKVSNEQLQYYTRHLENELLDLWQKNPTDFKEIQAHLTKVLKEILLEDSKAGKLGNVMQEQVLVKFRESLINHITILDDLSRYPALNEKFKSIFVAVQAGNIRKDVTFEAVDKLVANYTQFDKKVMADVNSLFRDDVIPVIIENMPVPINLKRAAVNSVIRDQQNNAINLLIGTYVTKLLNSTITSKINEDIRLDQGSFKGVVEQIIRQAVFAFKHNVEDICITMPDSQELFADIHQVMLRIEDKVDVHKASDARIRQLERSMVELAQAYNQLLAENGASVSPSAPPTTLIGTEASSQGGRRFLGFFDRAATPAESNSTSTPPKSQFN